MDVGDAEDARNDGVGLAVGEVLGDDVFGDAIEEDHQGGDGEDGAAAVFRHCADCRVGGFVGCGHQACGSVVLGGAV